MPPLFTAAEPWLTCEVPGPGCVPSGLPHRSASALDLLTTALFVVSRFRAVAKTFHNVSNAVIVSCNTLWSLSNFRRRVVVFSHLPASQGRHVVFAWLLVDSAAPLMPDSLHAASGAAFADGLASTSLAATPSPFSSPYSLPSALTLSRAAAKRVPGLADNLKEAHTAQPVQRLDPHTMLHALVSGPWGNSTVRVPKAYNIKGMQHQRHSTFPQLGIWAGGPC